MEALSYASSISVRRIQGSILCAGARISVASTMISEGAPLKRVQEFLYLEGIGLSVQNADADLPLQHSAAKVYQAFRLRCPIEQDWDRSGVGPLLRRGLDTDRCLAYDGRLIVCQSDGI